MQIGMDGFDFLLHAHTNPHWRVVVEIVPMVVGGSECEEHSGCPLLIENGLELLPFPVPIWIAPCDVGAIFVHFLQEATCLTARCRILQFTQPHIRDLGRLLQKDFGLTQ